MLFVQRIAKVYNIFEATASIITQILNYEDDKAFYNINNEPLLFYIGHGPGKRSRNKD